MTATEAEKLWEIIVRMYAATERVKHSQPLWKRGEVYNELRRWEHQLSEAMGAVLHHTLNTAEIALSMN